MNEIRQFRQNNQIVNGINAETNLKMFDIIPGQHENLDTNTNKQVKISIAQTLCEPVAVCSTNNPENGQYTATCVNFPDFAVSFVDSNGVRHNLVGLKLRVIFEHGITYGSVASGTFPTLSINGSEALPLLAQGKTMAQGAIVAGQSVEFTIIPYGNSIAFDADSNVRENTNDYTIYTDGLLDITKIFTVKLVGRQNDSQKTPYTIISKNVTGYRIANKTYVLYFELNPQNSDPAPSSVIHLIEIDNINDMSLIGAVYVRAPSYNQGAMLQKSGKAYYLRKEDSSGNWCPAYWGTGYNTVVQGCVIVRV